MREQPLIRCEPPCADAVLDRENRRFAPAFRRFYGKKCRFCRLRAAFGLPFCGLICYNAQRTLLILYFWLLQLIPARGRKPQRFAEQHLRAGHYNSSPRGDGNTPAWQRSPSARITTHPREGTETKPLFGAPNPLTLQLIPARGRKPTLRRAASWPA